LLQPITELEDILDSSDYQIETEISKVTRSGVEEQLLVVPDSRNSRRAVPFLAENRFRNR
jgi:hypothetical protein